MKEIFCLRRIDQTFVSVVNNKVKQKKSVENIIELIQKINALKYEAMSG